MNKQLLVKYLRFLVQEGELARVPNQLVSDNGEEEDEPVVEFSGAGAAMGFVGPIGSEEEKSSSKKR